jgi:hypothetical protein
MAMNAGIIGILIVQWLTEDRPPEQNETTFVPWRDGMGNKHTLELRRQFWNHGSETEPNCKNPRIPDVPS